MRWAKCLNNYKNNGKEMQFGFLAAVFYDTASAASSARTSS